MLYIIILHQIHSITQVSEQLETAFFNDLCFVTGFTGIKRALLFRCPDMLKLPCHKVSRKWYEMCSSNYLELITDKTRHPIHISYAKSIFSVRISVSQALTFCRVLDTLTKIYQWENATELFVKEISYNFSKLKTMYNNMATG